MNKNKQHNDLEMKCNKTRTAHSQVRYLQGGVHRTIKHIWFLPPKMAIAKKNQKSLILG